MMPQQVIGGRLAVFQPFLQILRHPQMEDAPSGLGLALRYNIFDPLMGKGIFQSPVFGGLCQQFFLGQLMTEIGQGEGILAEDGYQCVKRDTACKDGDQVQKLPFVGGQDGETVADDVLRRPGELRRRLPVPQGVQDLNQQEGISAGILKNLLCQRFLRLLLSIAGQKTSGFFPGKALKGTLFQHVVPLSRLHKLLDVGWKDVSAGADDPDIQFMETPQEDRHQLCAGAVHPMNILENQKNWGLLCDNGENCQQAALYHVIAGLEWVVLI